MSLTLKQSLLFQATVSLEKYAVKNTPQSGFASSSITPAIACVFGSAAATTKGVKFIFVLNLFYECDFAFATQKSERHKHCNKSAHQQNFPASSLRELSLHESEGKSKSAKRIDGFSFSFYICYQLSARLSAAASAAALLLLPG